MDEAGGCQVVSGPLVDRRRPGALPVTALVIAAGRPERRRVATSRDDAAFEIRDAADVAAKIGCSWMDVV